MIFQNSGYDRWKLWTWYLKILGMIGENSRHVCWKWKFRTCFWKILDLHFGSSLFSVTHSCLPESAAVSWLWSYWLINWLVGWLVIDWPIDWLIVLPAGASYSHRSDTNWDGHRYVSKARITSDSSHAKWVSWSCFLSLVVLLTLFLVILLAPFVMLLMSKLLFWSWSFSCVRRAISWIMLFIYWSRW